MKKIIAALFTITLAMAAVNPVQAKAPQTILLWENASYDEQIILDQLIDQFQHRNKDIIIKRGHFEYDDLLHAVQSSAEGDTGPDLILSVNSDLGVYVPDNILVPVTDIMGDDYLKLFDPQAVSGGTYNEKVYMIPCSIGDELCLIYNKALVPQAPETWEEMKQIGEELKTSQKTRATLSMLVSEPYFTLPFMNCFGAQVFDNPASEDAHPTLDTTQVQEWLRFLKQNQDEGIITSGLDYSQASQWFIEGKAPFLINGPWSFGEYKHYSNMEIGVAPLPRVNGIWPAPYFQIKGYSVTRFAVSNKKKSEAVNRFLTFFNNRNSQLSLSQVTLQLPALLEARNDPIISENPLMSEQNSQLEKAIPMPITAKMRSIWDAVRPVQNDYFKGKTELEDAPLEMQTKANDLIKERETGTISR